MRISWHVGLGRDLGLAFWAMTFFEATFGAFTSIWPLWIEDRGAPIAMVGIVLGSAGFVRPFVIGPSSWLTERFERKWLLITSRSLGIAGLLVAAFAGSWPILFITVVLNGMSELVFPVLQSYIAERSTENRARAFSMIVNVGPSFALIVTPLVSGLMIAQWGMQSAFFLASFTSLVSILFLSRMDFSTLPDDDDTDMTSARSYGAAFNHGEIRSLFIVHGLTILALAVGVSLVPIFLSEVRGLEPGLISSLGASAAVGTVLFGLWVSRSTRLAANPLAASAIACGAISAGLLIFAFGSAMHWIVLAFFLRGGMFASWAMILARMGEVAPARLRSRAFAVVEILGGSAMSFGPIIASVLYGFDPGSPIIVGAFLGGLMAIRLGWMQRRGPTREPASAPAN
jgi:MFS family permease